MKKLSTLMGLVLLLALLSVPALADGNMETPPAPASPPTTQDGNMETPPLPSIADSALSVALCLAGIL
jgi:hypothetical protein